jgi:hypothetical protein
VVPAQVQNVVGPSRLSSGAAMASIFPVTAPAPSCG